MTTNKRRQAVTSLMSGTVVQVAANASAALLSTVVLPAADRGLMVVALAIPTLISPILTLGTGNALRSILPRSPDSEAMGVVAAYTRLSVASSVFGALIAAVLCIPLSYLTDDALRSGPFVLAISVSVCVLVATQQITEAWYSQGKFRIGARWAASAAVVGLAGVVLGCLAHASASTLVLLQALFSGASVAASIVYGRQHGVLAVGSPARLPYSQLVATGARSLGHPIGMALLMRSDRIILASVAGPQAVATYALAATVAETVRIGPTAVAQLLTNDIATRRSDLSIVRAQLGGLAAVTIMGIPLVVAAHFLFTPVFGDEYAASVGLLAILMAAEWGFSLFIFAVRGFIGGGWVSEVSFVGLLAGLGSVPAYLLGARLGDATGCAWACVALYTVVGAFATLRLARKHPTKFDVVAPTGGPQ
ncbi:O-antigen/teichoic acid export membrane protein [Aeromicrobium panaciterrae]|uniref:O-antigen/teichoic acid export membrane protein n=1 Tax=Aeromicrobium panaciterrae TaxID=363861 RepID=A0ABU1ULA0_9ACTN|nr:oligosaccharide flippase family protein [Aeromicrobium panaciterrae]MDR7085924.1 O-antigen/teichoic acid export membrane protein [Aeromicrobium panaciterrae]